MKLKNILIISLLFLVVATGYFVFGDYFNGNIENANENLIDVKLDENFNLKIGQTAVLGKEKIKIKLADVSNDSRCPSGVQCFWAGQAIVVVNAEDSQGNSQNIELTFGAGMNGSNIKNIGGYSIKLVNVEPSPRIGEKIEKTDYTASFIVSASTE